MKTTIPLFCCFLAFAGCRVTTGPVDPPGPTTPVDCPAVCAHYRELHCEAGDPTPGGISCERVCEETLASGALNYDGACMLAITRCEDDEKCGRSP